MDSYQEYFLLYRNMLNWAEYYLRLVNIIGKGIGIAGEPQIEETVIGVTITYIVECTFVDGSYHTCTHLS